MSETTNPDTQLRSLSLWYDVTTTALAELPYDLSQRQIAVLLTVYMAPPPHTVRGMATRLGISKPAICRALDTLSRMDFIRRKKDDADRRNVYIQRTIAGSVFLHDFANIISRCSGTEKQAEATAKPSNKSVVA